MGTKRWDRPPGTVRALIATFGPQAVLCRPCKRYRRAPGIDRPFDPCPFTCALCGQRAELVDAPEVPADFVNTSDAADIVRRFNAAFPDFDYRRWGWHFEPVESGSHWYAIAGAGPRAHGEISVYMLGAEHEEWQAVEGWLTKALNPARHVPGTMHIHGGHLGGASHHRFGDGPWQPPADDAPDPRQDGYARARERSPGIIIGEPTPTLETHSRPPHVDR